MNQQPDLTFYFAVHEAQRHAIARYHRAVATLDERDRAVRGKALRRWTRGFILELEEHHYVEDAFFFPSLRDRVPTAGTVLDALETEHRQLDELLARWWTAAQALADTHTPFTRARTDVVDAAADLADFLTRHLAVEDHEVLPLFWRHYSAAEYDAVEQQAVKKGKKAGLWFVAPFAVDCYPEGPERDAFLASVPGVLRLLHRIVRPSYDRLAIAALGPVEPANVTTVS